MFQTLLSDEDTEKLIQEIEKRPSLYDKTCGDYRNGEEKRRLWDEIYEAVLDDWNSLSHTQQRIAGQEVQKRWRNLRCCFGREVKHQRENQLAGKQKRRRKYLYFDNLKFLLRTMKTPSSAGPSGGKRDSVFIDTYFDPDDDFAEVETDDDDDPISRTTPTDDLSDRRSSVKSSSGRQKKQTFEDDSLLAAFNGGGKTEANPAESISFDADTNFALSLVPNLQALSDDDKLEAQIQILSVFKSLKRKRATHSKRSQSPTNPTAGGSTSSRLPQNCKNEMQPYFHD